MANCGHPQCRDLTGCIMPQVQYWPNPLGTVHAVPLSSPQGWICPRCGFVYSPQTPQCWTCNANPKPLAPDPGKEP